MMTLLKYIVRFFAVIGILAILMIFGLSVLIVKSLKSEKVTVPEKVILTLKLNHSIQEVTSIDNLSSFFAPPKDYRVLINSLDKAANDDRVKGIFIQYQNSAFGPAEIQEFRRALKNFMSKGKKCSLHADSFGEEGSGTFDYYLASGCETISLQSTGMVGLNGLYITMPFGKDFFQKFGVKPDFLHVGDYKSFVEPFERDDFSAAHYEMEKDLMAQYENAIVRDVSADQKFDPDHFKEIFTNGPYFDTESLEKYKLVQEIGYYQDVKERYLQMIDEEAQYLSIFKYAESLKDNPTEMKLKVDALTSKIKEVSSDNDADQKKEEPEGSTGSKKVAFILAYGEVVRGFKQAPFGESEKIESYVLADQIEKAAADKDIAGIILRINSPGGSPVASDTIGQAILRTKVKYQKPVIISVANMAASGGYWIAAHGDKIVAEELSLTGSIGVFGGKFVIRDFSEMMGVHWRSVSTGGTAGIMSMTDEFDDVQRAKYQGIIESLYDRFVGLVAEQRGMSKDEVEKYAKGRVWTGKQALEFGLIDALGGMDVARGLMAETLGLSDQKDLNLIYYPAQKTPFEEIFSFTDQDMEASISSFFHQLLMREVKGFFYRNQGVSASLMMPSMTREATHND